ncbi:MAG: hypothetical protein QME51_05710, partial [Planctomycetota bacterium]|nr:hypothetical protein [Planctomycetota bacterium]
MEYKDTMMLISKTPLRASFTGGGCDVHNYYSKFGGEVVSCAINRYVYITAFKRFDKKIIVSYRQLESVDSAEEIKHSIVRTCLQKTGTVNGIELHMASEISTIGTGLGGSSAITIGCLNVLYGLKGQFLSKEQLAREACDVEINLLGKQIGKQDQYACAIGGLNHLEFLPNETVLVTALPEETKSLAGKLYLIDCSSGMRQAAEAALAKQHNRFKKNISILAKMKNQCSLLIQALKKNSDADIVSIINKAWKLKKKLGNHISSPEIDAKLKEIREMGGAGKLC